MWIAILSLQAEWKNENIMLNNVNLHFLIMLNEVQDSSLSKTEILYGSKAISTLPSTGSLKEEHPV